MMVSRPRKPSSRSASAARSPVSDAPTMTIRPVSLNAFPFMGRRLVAVERFHDDRLHRACRRGPQYPQPVPIIRVGVVGEGFLTAELQHLRRQRHTMRVTKAAVQVDDDSHSWPRSSWLKIQCVAAYIQCKRQSAEYESR